MRSASSPVWDHKQMQLHLMGIKTGLSLSVLSGTSASILKVPIPYREIAYVLISTTF